MTVGWDVEGFVVIEEFEDVAVWWSSDDRGRDKLVHRFVISRVGGIMNETGAAGVDRAREECEANVAVMRDAL